MTIVTTEIRAIDRQIDAIRAQLSAVEKIDELSAASWQAAWDKHPELRDQETELFRQRGFAQQRRDEMLNKVWAKERRQKRPKKCPTCGHRTLAA